MDRNRRLALATALIGSHRAQGTSTEGIVAVLDQATVEGVLDDDYVYREGERAEDLHILIEGSVRVLVGPDQHELTRVKAPAILGHLGVLSGLNRSASVVAVGNIRVARLGYRDMWELIRGDSDVGVALRRLLLASMAMLIGDTNARLVELVPDYGVPMPKDAPRAGKKPAAADKKRSQLSTFDQLAAGFDPDLLAEAENIRVVHTEADERHKYKG